MYGVVSVVSGMSCIWSIMAITLERAWVVHCLIRAKQQRVARNTMRILVATIWLVAAVISIPPLVGWNRYVYEVGFEKM